MHSHFGDFFGRHGRHDCRRSGGRGGFFGRHGMGGPGIRAAKMLASGDLQLIILALLKDKPRHGYEVIKALEEHSSGIYTPSPGMVYPALTYLEEMGFAEASTEGAKKLYTLTPLGDEHLTKNRTAANETLEQLARFGRKLAGFQKQFNDEENDDDDFARGRRHHGPGREEFRQLKAEFRDLRDQLKAALFEKMDASVEEKKRVFDILRQAINDIRSK